MISQKQFDRRSLPIAAPQPNYFGWRPQQRSHLSKIRIERHESKFICLSVIPERAITRTLQSEQADLARTRKQIVQLSRKLETEVLVKQKLHFAATMRRSRSAA